jgi:acyl-CoA reductase-like NAD-dependent aldehyde dehydrogenase
MSEPEKIYAGTTVSWTIPAGDYDAATWTLTYTLISKDKETITITGADDGNGDHLVNASSATTANWLSGEYYWQRSVSDGASRHVTGTGRLQVYADYAAGALDPRSSAKITLDALNAVRENKATSDQLSMSISGRSISRMSWAEINDAVRHFQRLVDEEIAKEKDERGESTKSNTVKVTFGNV